MPRFTGGAVGALSYDAISTFEPSVPLPDRDPVERPAGELHRDRPRDRVRPPHPPAERDRVAPHRGAGPRRPVPDRRAGDLRGARADRPPAARPRSTAAFGRSTADDGATDGSRLGQVETSLGRDEYIRAVEQAKDAIAAGEAIQVVLARRQCFDLPTLAGRRADRRHRPLPRAPAGQPQPVPVLHPDARDSRSSAPARSSSSRWPGDRMSTHPIAGTRPRGTTPADDDRLADELRNDPKERAEHVMLVDLGRNDLGRVAKPGTVTTSQYMEVERYSHVLHLVSHVEARLRAGAGRARRAAVRVPRRHPHRRARRSARCSSSPRPRASGAGCMVGPWATSATTATSTRRSRSGAPS